MSRYDLESILLSCLAIHSANALDLANRNSIDLDAVSLSLRSLEKEGIVVQCPQTRVFRIAEMNDLGWAS